jgi:acetylornithine deacetylase/succinyl-diaminopimelate desuccinylase-like protein
LPTFSAPEHTKIRESKTRREIGMSDAKLFIEANQDRFLNELYDLLRIPSVSAVSKHDPDTREAAEWVAESLRGAGLTAEIHETPGHPIVLAERRDAGPDAPTILIYGHYDVQPVEPLDEWVSPPFEPEVRDGRIWGRGTADDKGQLFMHVKALEASLQDGDTLPVNVIVLAEGEEEIGSPNLVPFVKEHRDRLACDYVVISDTGMFAPGLPSLIFSLRGLAYFEVQVQGPSSDLHSGAYGGAVPNPTLALARIFASLHDDQGRIAIDGFYDDVVDWDEDTRESIRDLPFDPEEFRAEVGADGLTGEAGYSSLERLWIRPACDANGLLSGWTGEGAKTVLPARAMGKVSFRLVPDQDPDQVEKLFRAHVEKVTPEGVRVSVRALHGGRPWKATVGGRGFDAASAALERAFGTTPVLQGEGGSIPIVVEFEEVLEASALLVGFSLPGSNLHAPNEWLSVENFQEGIKALAYLYQELGA